MAWERMSNIGPGLLVLVGIGRSDAERDAAYLAAKTAGLRIFEGEEGRMTRSVRDLGGAVLAVPQFTLYGDVRPGLRSSFDGAAPPGAAEPLYDRYVRMLRAEGPQVATGVFRTTMRVTLVNEVPVTVLVDSAKWL